MASVSAPAQALVRLDQVAVRFGERTVLEDVSFEVAQGEFLYLIGRTGAGKTSLLRLLYADLLPSQGQVWVDGQDVPSLTSTQIPYLRRKLGIVFQDFQLLPDRTVGENLLFVLRATGQTGTAALKQRLSDVLMLVGLSAKVNQLPHQLSGGEQQRTALARALINKPLLLIADEPTGNLDPEVTGAIMEILHQAHKVGTTVIMATHAYALIERFPARVIECKDGHLLDRGRGHRL